MVFQQPSKLLNFNLRNSLNEVFMNRYQQIFCIHQKLLIRSIYLYSIDLIITCNLIVYFDYLMDENQHLSTSTFALIFV